jgi:ACS family glucarate transporter-like MFS transporter
MDKFQGRKSRQRFVLISILFFHSMNTYMDRACIASAADRIMEDLHISLEIWGLILGIFAVGYALFQIPSGWIADKFGPRKALTIVVSVWSCFTALTGAATNAIQMLVLRFLFGVGEAGAFPGAAQAFYRWLPAKERGLAHGINFSGSRLGAALSLFLMPILIRGCSWETTFWGLLNEPFPIIWSGIGWRWTFVFNGVIGIIWATVWLIWFRDNPQDNKKVTPAELAYIEKGRVEDLKTSIKSSFVEVFTSLNMSLAMMQYFASNVTFYITLTWLPLYMGKQWGEKAIFASAIPLVGAAAANWLAGTMVTQLHKKGYHVGSRRITAIIGFSLGVLGLVLATQTDSLAFFVFAFSLATFGVDMTLSPSWAFCNDIGGGKSGAVSGAMNMVGNIGGALSAIIFPLLLSEDGSANTFFILAAVINGLAIVCWLFMNPNRTNDKALSPATIKVRFIAMITIYTTLLAGAIGFNMVSGYQKNKAKLAEQKQEAMVDTSPVDVNQLDPNAGSYPE